MLPQLEIYLSERWHQLPQSDGRPKRLSFLGQATGVGKACFFVFADRESVPRYIVKMPRSPLDNDELQREVAAIESLRASVSERLRATLPGPMHTTELAGHFIVVERVLPGRPLDNLGSGRGFRPEIVERQLDVARNWLTRVQHEASPQSGRLQEHDIRSHFIRPLLEMGRMCDLTPTELRYLDSLMASALTLEGTDCPIHIHHGDFRAGNMLLDGDQLSVLDWQYSQPRAAPLLDWFSFVFRLYCRSVALPDIDGTQAQYEDAFRAAFYETSWFSEMAARHTRRYCVDVRVDLAHLPLLMGLTLATEALKFQTFLTRRAERGYLYLLQGQNERELSYRRRIQRQAYVCLFGELARNHYQLLACA